MLFEITALSVFVLPENILDASAACADFVKFMKQFFPNIAAIGKISPHTQLAEFYVAALRISLAGFFVISWIFIPTSLFLYGKKKLEDVKTQLLYFFGIFIGYLGVSDYFTADFAVNGIHHRVGNGQTFPKFESRESLFGWISFFTATSMFMSMLVVISLSDIVHWIYLSRNKS